MGLMKFSKTLVIVLTPIILLPLPLLTPSNVSSNPIVYVRFGSSSYVDCYPLAGSGHFRRLFMFFGKHGGQSNR